MAKCSQIPGEQRLINQFRVVLVLPQNILFGRAKKRRTETPQTLNLCRCNRVQPVGVVGRCLQGPLMLIDRDAAFL